MTQPTSRALVADYAVAGLAAGAEPLRRRRFATSTSR